MGDAAEPDRTARSLRAKLARPALAAYALLLALSHAWIATRPERGARELDVAGGDVALAIPAFDDRGPVPERECRVVLTRHGVAAPTSERAPVVLLHGSPGSRRDMDALARELASGGRAAWTMDLPGFGDSDRDVPSFSIVAHARALIAALDALGIPRAHLVAWSMGGGVALHAADLAPERVASIALLASIGVQEGEGSGSYVVEHAKYAALQALIALFEHGVPHLGALGSFEGARSFARNFWDSDQRPLRAILARAEAPILIVHGRGDFLVPPWTARESHRLAPRSRLVVLEASHFLPWREPLGNLRATLAEVGPFLERHDAGGAGEKGEVDLTRSRSGLDRLDFEPMALSTWVPWWLSAGALAAAVLKWPRAGALVAAALAAAVQVDPWLALAASSAGSAAQAGLARRAARACLGGGAKGLAIFAVGALALAALATGLRPALPRPLGVAFGAAALLASASAWRRWRARRAGARG